MIGDKKYHRLGYGKEATKLAENLYDFGYKLNVMISMKESAKKWGGLTKKQMGYLNKLYEHYKPWYDKKIKKNEKNT